MGLLGLLAVFSGAGLGACLRWGLSLLLNPLFPAIPLGTLSANLLGGYLVGLAIVFSPNASFSPELRLLIITGFLGGLTTFSTFSSEVVSLLQRSHYGLALLTASIHLLGSVALTVVGIITAKTFME